MKVLVINAGSSSLKYQLLNTDTKEVMAKGLAERIGINDSLLSYKRNNADKIEKKIDMPDHTAAIEAVLGLLSDKTVGVIKSMSEIDAVGHRVVHGGEKFAAAAVITPEVKKAIEECVDLAPLHNPPNLTGIEACQAAMPNVPQVAVFDTAFHQTMPAEAYMYAIPYEYYEKYKVRRYGFHGTSHAYVAERAGKILGRDWRDLKIITCHLGNGSSIAAIKNGKCIDTSMGFTPLAGVPMGTRSGDIDPAILKFLGEKENLSLSELDTILNKKSGMVGVSGVGSDFRDLGAAKATGNARADLALKMFSYAVRKYIGAYTAALNGVDVIVFTAGVGENGSAERQDICCGLDYLGLVFDEEANKVARGIEKIISKPESKVTVMAIPTNEELSIALETERLTAK